MTGLLTDDRAQSIGIARFFLALIVGAVMFFVIDTVTSPILDHARDKGNTTEAAEATAWFSTLVDSTPMVFLLISFFGLLVLAIFQREVLR